MDSPLNPDAAEFIPSSPTYGCPAVEELLAQSPLKGSPVPMVDVKVPSQSEFLQEASTRPGDLEFVNSSSQDDAQRQLDVSDISSTKAEFGDESTTSFVTSTSDVDRIQQKVNYTEDTENEENMERSFREKDLFDTEISRPMETHHLSFELQKDLVPRMEAKPELVQLDSEDTSSSRDLEQPNLILVPASSQPDKPALAHADQSVPVQAYEPMLSQANEPTMSTAEEFVLNQVNGAWLSQTDEPLLNQANEHLQKQLKEPSVIEAKEPICDQSREAFGIQFDESSINVVDKLSLIQGNEPSTNWVEEVVDSDGFVHITPGGLHNIEDSMATCEDIVSSSVSCEVTKSQQLEQFASGFESTTSLAYEQTLAFVEAKDDSDIHAATRSNNCASPLTPEYDIVTEKEALHGEFVTGLTDIVEEFEPSVAATVPDLLSPLLEPGLETEYIGSRSPLPQVVFPVPRSDACSPLPNMVSPVPLRDAHSPLPGMVSPVPLHDAHSPQPGMVSPVPPRDTHSPLPGISSPVPLSEAHSPQPGMPSYEKQQSPNQFEEQFGIFWPPTDPADLSEIMKNHPLRMCVFPLKPHLLNREQPVEDAEVGKPCGDVEFSIIEPVLPVDLGAPATPAAVCEALMQAEQLLPFEEGIAVTAAAAVAATVATAVAAGAILMVDKKEVAKKTAPAKKPAVEKTKTAAARTVLSAKPSVTSKVAASPTKPLSASSKVPAHKKTPTTPPTKAAVSLKPSPSTRSRPVAPTTKPAAPTTKPAAPTTKSAAPTTKVSTTRPTTTSTRPATTTAPRPKTAPTASPTKPAPIAKPRTTTASRPAVAERKASPMTNGEVGKPIKRPDVLAAKKPTTTSTVLKSTTTKLAGTVTATKTTTTKLVGSTTTRTNTLASTTAKPKSAAVNGVASRPKPLTLTRARPTSAQPKPVTDKQVKETANKQISSARTTTTERKSTVKGTRAVKKTMEPTDNLVSVQEITTTVISTEVKVDPSNTE